MLIYCTTMYSHNGPNMNETTTPTLQSDSSTQRYYIINHLGISSDKRHQIKTITSMFYGNKWYEIHCCFIGIHNVSKRPTLTWIVPIFRSASRFCHTFTKICAVLYIFTFKFLVFYQYLIVCGFEIFKYSGLINKLLRYL